MTMISEDCLGDVTERIGADTTANWERGETASAHVPKLLRFLIQIRDISPSPGQAFSELSKGVRPVASRAAAGWASTPRTLGGGNVGCVSQEQRGFILSNVHSRCDLISQYPMTSRLA